MGNGIEWVGHVDWHIRNFHGHRAERGSTYNAYLVMDERTAVIDTVKSPYGENMIRRLMALTDLSKVDFLVCNHAEPDHSGSLPIVMAACPNAELVCNSRCREALSKHYDTAGWKFRVIRDGESISLGKRSLKFIETPMAHWPESMFTYVPEERLLFSMDAFGQHYASAHRFDDEAPLDIVMAEAKTYYANIVMLYSKPIARVLKRAEGLDIRMIAPSHGVAWRKNAHVIMSAYRDWASGKPAKKVLVIYDTMWGSTGKMAEAIADGAMERDVDVKLCNIRATNLTVLATEMLDAAAAAFGSPTLNKTLMPEMAAVLTYLKGLSPRGKAGFSFGSYGWTKGGAQAVEECLKAMNFDILRAPIEVQFAPPIATLNECRAAGRILAERALGNADGESAPVEFTGGTEFVKRMNLKVETRLEGIGLSGGYAVARVCLFNEQRHNNLPTYKVSGAGVEREMSRVTESIAVAERQLEKLRDEVKEQIGSAEAEIFVAQKMILNDETLCENIFGLINRDNINAETAVALALDEYERKLADMDNEYIRERATDFGEIKRRLLDVLGDIRPELLCAGDEEYCQRGRNRIIVAEEMTPTLTVDMDTDHTMGFVTEHGGRNSHAAILARALGIPAVSGIKGIHARVACGTEILVNGDTGEIVIWPTEKTVMNARMSYPASMRMPKPAEPVAGCRVMANINAASEVDHALEMKAEGIGLYRTEMELLAAGRLLSEDELFERYSSVVKAMKGKAVVVRLFDIGSDKTLPFLEIALEENPSLGWRGARLLLGRTDLLAPQARALARTSQYGPVNVLYPMIVDIDQFRALREAFLNATRDISIGELRHGTMFEVPSACLQAEKILEEAEFGSIGANDLTQYLFAVDRDNELVAHDYDPDHPVFWDLVRDMVQAARKTGKSLSVCGEMAGDPRYVTKLVDIGIDTVSVSSRRIPLVRSVLAGRPAGGR